MSNENKTEEKEEKGTLPPKTAAKTLELPDALTRASAEELFSGKGRKLFAEVALAGGYGNASHLGSEVSLDLKGLKPDTLEAVRAVFAKFGK